MRAWGKTDKGLVRESNQDAFAIELDAARSLALLVVCDGMGGAKSGDVASGTATAAFTAEVLSGIGDNVDRQLLRELITAAVTKANSAVNQRAADNPSCYGMGTTLVSALVMGSDTIVVNVGDSRAYHIANGAIARLTRDHSVVEDMMMSGDITVEQARSHPSKNLITRAIGGDHAVEGDIYEHSFGTGEYVLLCSDGLSNMLEDHEILHEVLNCGDADGAVTRLIDRANERGGRDNITVALLEL